MELINTVESHSGMIVSKYGLIVNSVAERGVILTDLDMKNSKRLFDYSKVIYSDGKVYHTIVEKDENGKAISIEFLEYDLETHTDRSIGKTKGSSLELLCVAEGYLYYLPNSPEATPKVTVYRVDIETGEVKTAMNDPKALVQEMYYVNGKYYAYCSIANSLAPWIHSDLLVGSSIGGELVDRNNDGLFEFEPFVFDATDFP